MVTTILAGQVPEESAGSDAKAQTASCLSQIDALLAKAGSDKTKLLSATVRVNWTGEAQLQSPTGGVAAVEAFTAASAPRPHNQPFRRIITCITLQVYLTSMEHYAGMNAAWEEWMPAGCAPARATVGNVTLARPEWKVEIVIVAAQS